MKHLRKLAAVMMAMVMALSMTAVAFAATVTNNTDHSYNAYQVFSGTQATSGAELGDAEWGTGINGAAFLAELKTDARFNVGAEGANIFASCTTALDVASALSVYGDSSDVAKAFANVAAKHLTSTSTSIAADATTVELEPGYYLLVDTAEPADGDAKNSALLQVTNKGDADIVIAKKYDVPTADKSVKDTDGTWGEAADWEIGSNVPFKLTGTLPTNLADYETYTYVFHDTLSAGLQYNGDAKVYLVNNDGRTDITANATIAPAAAATTGGGTLTVTFADLKAVSGVTSTSQIVVEYTAELLSSAVIGGAGNSNKVYVEYSNDPNTTGDGTTGNTPEDEAKVYSYQLNVVKVDGQNTETKLEGAEFVLLSADKAKVAKVADGKLVEWVAVPEAVDGKITYPDGTTLTSDANGLFGVAGLDAGTYYLCETKAPSSYNLLKSDIKLQIVATLDKTEQTGPALTTLALKVNDGNAVDGDLAAGTVTTTVNNNRGTVLPETGGMGTTVFYVVGGALVLVAVVLLVTKKRMNDAEK